MCHKNLKFLFLTTTEIKMPTDSKTKRFKISHFKTHIVNKILNTQLKFFRLGSCTWNSLPWLLPCPLGLNSNLSSSVLTTPCKVKSFPFLCFTLWYALFPPPLSCKNFTLSCVSFIFPLEQKLHENNNLFFWFVRVPQPLERSQVY